MFPMQEFKLKNNWIIDTCIMPCHINLRCYKGTCIFMSNTLVESDGPSSNSSSDIFLTLASCILYLRPHFLLYQEDRVNSTHCLEWPSRASIHSKQLMVTSSNWSCRSDVIPQRSIKKVLDPSPRLLILHLQFLKLLLQISNNYYFLYNG